MQYRKLFAVTFIHIPEMGLYILLCYVRIVLLYDENLIKSWIIFGLIRDYIGPEQNSIHWTCPLWVHFL